MIKLSKEKTPNALEKGEIIDFPNSNMTGVVLDVFISGTEIKYVAISENLHYAVITMDIKTGKYSMPEETVDLISIAAELRQNPNEE